MRNLGAFSNKLRPVMLEFLTRRAEPDLDWLGDSQQIINVPVRRSG